MSIRLLLNAATAALLAPFAVAQQPPELGPRSFFPPDYVGEAYVDFDALLDTDVWDELERSAMTKMSMAMFKREFGFRLVDLTALRMAMVYRKAPDDPDMPEYRMDSVTVFEGPGPFALPPPREGEYELDRRTAERIGGADVVREGPESEGYWQPKLFVVPKPEFLVYGDKRLIEPVLRGERRGGVPNPELMAFTATQRPMAYVAFKMDYDSEHLRQMAPFPVDWYTELDKPTFWMARLTVDEESGHAHATARMRFQTGDAGPELMTEKVRAAFAEIDTDPRLKNMAFLKELVKQVTFDRDGTDWVARLDLGVGGKLAGGLMSANLLPLLLLAPRTVEERVIVMEAEGEEVELEAAEEVAESEWEEAETESVKKKETKETKETKEKEKKKKKKKERVPSP